MRLLFFARVWKKYKDGATRYLVTTHRWAAFPFAALVCHQGRVPWAQPLWVYFVLLWMVGGGWWGVVGCGATTVITAVSHLALWWGCGLAPGTSLAILTHSP